jgi:hypothetical protein
MHAVAYLSSPTTCSVGRSNIGGYHPRVSGPLGPVVCRILDMNFREFLFHALG